MTGLVDQPELCWTSVDAPWSTHESVMTFRNFTCYLAAGHEGDHEAHCDDDVFVWDDGLAEDWANGVWTACDGDLPAEAITNG